MLWEHLGPDKGGFSEGVTQQGAGSVVLVAKGTRGREFEWGKTCMTPLGNPWKSSRAGAAGRGETGAGGGGKALAMKSQLAHMLRSLCTVGVGGQKDV